MESSTESARIEALFQALTQAHAEHDADAIVSAYAPDAVIFDLAPPLGRRGLDREQVAAWLATWKGPLEVEAEDAELTIKDNFAFSTALNRMHGYKGGEETDIWFRCTLCLEIQDGHWKIVHEHTSVPFYMDGSYHAAVDLKP